MTAPTDPYHSLRAALIEVVRGGTLTAQQAEETVTAMLSPGADSLVSAALLAALATRCETGEELAGAVRAVRRRGQRIAAPPATIDVCGTGGDNASTLNISSAVAFVVAACGVPVAKHGNRAASSRSGAADVMEQLGVRIDAAPLVMETLLSIQNIAFLFAPLYHPGLAPVAALRRTLGIRTLFNITGPLANPAGVSRQLIGVAQPRMLGIISDCLQALQIDSAWVIHGAGGVDELTLAGENQAVIIRGAERKTLLIKPEDAGLERAPIEAIRGASAAENAAALRRLLEGEAGPYRNTVLLNAAAALVLAGKAEALVEGVRLGAEAIDSGAARAKLDVMISTTRSAAAAAEDAKIRSAS